MRVRTDDAESASNDVGNSYFNPTFAKVEVVGKDD